MAWTRTRYLVLPVPDTNQPTICFGSGGSPNGVEVQPKGSKAIRIDGASAGLIEYVNTDGDKAWSKVAAGSSVQTEDLGTPAAKQVANIHAGVAGDDAVNDFPGPFTDPDVPRNLRVTFGAGWDGGDVTVVGTFNGSPQSEVFTAVAGTTVVGAKPFETAVSAAKGAVGVNPATASIGDGDTLGLARTPAEAIGTLSVDGVTEAATWDKTDVTVTPTTAPDGAKSFVAQYPTT